MDRLMGAARARQCRAPTHPIKELSVRKCANKPNAVGEKSGRPARHTDQPVFTNHDSRLTNHGPHVTRHSRNRYIVIPLINLGKKSVDFCGNTSPAMAIFATVSTLTEFKRKQICARP
jgi:hypothetical protein